ncbi:hypothetical protein SARC_07917, partial [Sphaeroforma arctica JP610]
MSAPSVSEKVTYVGKKTAKVVVIDREIDPEQYGHGDYKIFVANSIAFNAVNSQTLENMVTVIRKASVSHPIPHRHQLSSTLVPALFKTARDESMIVMNNIFPLCGGTVDMDGCTVMQESLINGVVKLGDLPTPLPIGIFNTKTHTLVGQKKTKEWNAEVAIDFINSLPYDGKFVFLFVSDTTGNMVKCWPIIEEKLPWISCAPDPMHVMNLVLMNEATIEDASNIEDTTATGATVGDDATIDDASNIEDTIGATAGDEATIDDASNIEDTTGATVGDEAIIDDTSNIEDAVQQPFMPIQT